MTLRHIFLRLAFAIAAFMFAALALLVTLAFAMVGIYLLLSDLLGPVWGAFATAGAALLIAAILIWAGTSYSHIFGRRRRKDAADPSFVAVLLGDLLGRRFSKLSDSNVRSSIFVSLAAGFAIGASPRLREYLFDLMRM